MLKKRIIASALTLLCFFVVFSSEARCETAPDYQRYSAWTYTIIHRVTITNDSSRTAYDIHVNVPLMDKSIHANQELIGEQFKPWPKKITTTDTGKRSADYEITSIAPNSEIVLEQRYTVANYALYYTFNTGKVSDTYDEAIDMRYTSPSADVQSTASEIVSYAKELSLDGTNPYQYAKHAFADINLYLTYDASWREDHSALNALRTGTGNCEDYTNLFVAALRAAGIPARQQTGYLYLPQEHNVAPYVDDNGEIDLSLISHAWPEFYLPDIGWVIADPTFTYTFEIDGSMEKFVDWDYFANLLPSHRLIFFQEDSASAGEIAYTASSLGSKPTVTFKASMLLGKYYYPFNDIEGHWAADDITYLAEYDPPLVAGIGQGLFAPRKTITRAQAAVMLQRVINGPVGELTYSDVDQDYWAASGISAASAAGWMEGFPDGTFRPEQVLNRAELASILVKAFSLKADIAEVQFNDLGQNGYAFADQDILVLANLGLTRGTEEGIYAPQKAVTRGEFASFIARILKPDENNTTTNQ